MAHGNPIKNVAEGSEAFTKIVYSRADWREARQTARSAARRADPPGGGGFVNCHGFERAIERYFAYNTGSSSDDNRIEYGRQGKVTRMTDPIAAYGYSRGDWREPRQMPRSGTRRAQAPGGGGFVNCHGTDRRITVTASGTTTHTYYNEAWRRGDWREPRRIPRQRDPQGEGAVWRRPSQPIEEREGSATDAERQWVWEPRNRNALILRDRDCPPAARDDLRSRFASRSPRSAAKQSTGDGSFDERLYATRDAMGSVTALLDTGGTV